MDAPWSEPNVAERADALLSLDLQSFNPFVDLAHPEFASECRAPMDGSMQTHKLLAASLTP